MHEQYSNPSRTAKTETMSRAPEAKTTRRPGFPQPHATYKSDCAANIPFGNVLVESLRFVKHILLWEQDQWCHIVIDDKSSNDIGQRKESCEIFGLMLTMSMIIIQNTWTIQQPFKDCNNNRDNAPSSRDENNKKTQIPTAPSHLQNRFRCQHSN